jgi:enoyl-[acyl-carrier-protein] reductase (NADH)
MDNPGEPTSEVVDLVLASLDYAARLDAVSTGTRDVQVMATAASAIVAHAAADLVGLNHALRAVRERQAVQ